MTKEEWNNLIDKTPNSLSDIERKEVQKMVDKIQNNFQIFIKSKSNKSIPINFSDEQLTAINCKDKYILLKARAGSGKTSVIVERTKKLLKDGVPNNEILILAFNKKASLEIQDRISQNFPHFQNSKTFHSFAYSIVKPNKIIFGKEQETFLQKIILENRNSFLDFNKKIKDEISTLKMNLSKNEFVKYIRANKNLTFKGTNIYSEHKSNGEKWISDFLFEHNVSFEYEKKFDWDGKPYKPDFEISPNIILEHWGIDENQKNGETPKNWTKSFSEYKNEINRKRKFWKNRNEIFIETSIVDLKNGRENFEKILKTKLEKVGIKLQKLPSNKIYDKLQFQTILKITNQVNSYISQAKQKNWTSKMLAEKIQNFPENKDFLLFANLIFEKYEKSNKISNQIDFLNLLDSAIQKISKNDISQLKYILIDEFQDFSPLFYKLIEEIKKLNPKINIFAVGDDWQSINGFAGSDLEYFNNFANYFPDAKILEMTTNYRSLSKIVDYGIDIFKDKNGAIVNRKGGEVLEISGLPDLPKDNTDRNRTSPFAFTGNKFENKNFEIITAHKSKGLEFDEVVILEKNFNKNHKDNHLTKIFGKTEQKILEEERRLFYVAVTRAKEKLYIIS